MRAGLVAALVVVLARSAAAQPAPPTPAPTPTPATPAPAPTPTPATPAPTPTTPAPAPTPTPTADPAPPNDAPADPTVAPVVPEVHAVEATPPTPPPNLGVRAIQIHGFVSEGGFLSTANNYIGESSRGSLELFEAGINFSTEIAEDLRGGIQLFARDFGVFDEGPRVDWAFLDYRWKPWLGLRAGIIRMPFGLYNEYSDIDAARLSILLPQSLYSHRNRDALLAHRGFSIYGHHAFEAAGELEYQAWLGSLSIPRSALILSGATLDRVDTKYVTGGQLFWRPPIEGLRVGGTVVRASIDFHIQFSPENVAGLIMAGLVPADFDGRFVISQRPVTLAVASAEYTRGNWLLAAEYGREFKRQRSTLPTILPTIKEDHERFYVMATYRMARRVETGAYYSVHHVDANDRRGRGPMFVEPFHAFQRDLAVTTRLEVNDHWLWKLEAHIIDGTADLPPELNTQPERFWGLFLAKTTVTF